MLIRYSMIFFLNGLEAVKQSDYGQTDGKILTYIMVYRHFSAAKNFVIRPK